MTVSHYLKSDYCIMDLQSQNKEEAIREIIKRISSSGRILDEEKFTKDVLERENLGSTGIGHNVAIPHARSPVVKEFMIGFAKSNRGVDFNALDGEKVNLIFLMGADPKELNLYLRILAELSKLLMNNSFRQSLLSAADGKEVLRIIEQFERE